MGARRSVFSFRPPVGDPTQGRPQIVPDWVIRTVAVGGTRFTRRQAITILTALAGQYRDIPISSERATWSVRWIVR